MIAKAYYSMPVAEQPNLIMSLVGVMVLREKIMMPNFILKKPKQWEGFILLQMLMNNLKLIFL